MHPLTRAVGIRAVAVVMALALSACAPGGPSPSPTPAPTTLPGPTAEAVSPAELRLLLVDRLGPRWYCDPDEYPVPRGPELQRATERFPEMQAENELFRAIAARLDVDLDADVSDADKLAIYRAWKAAVSIELTPVGDGRYRFDYLARPAPGAGAGARTAGLIADDGTISVEQQGAAAEPACPICLARGTLIDTPRGPVAVERLRLGDGIWTLDRRGRRVAGTVLAWGSTEAPPEHLLVVLELADGRTVSASPGHPLADGRPIGALRIGDAVDGGVVAALGRVPYSARVTFDLLASGETGAYLAGGIALGSTLD